MEYIIIGGLIAFGSYLVYSLFDYIYEKGFKHGMEKERRETK